MSLNVENAEMFLNHSAFAVQARIKEHAPRAGIRKATNFSPSSHQRVPVQIKALGAAHLLPADPMADSPEPVNFIRP